MCSGFKHKWEELVRLQPSLQINKLHEWHTNKYLRNDLTNVLYFSFFADLKTMFIFYLMYQFISVFWNSDRIAVKCCTFLLFSI